MNIYGKAAIFGLMLFHFGCKGTADQVSPCGCDGPTVNRLSQEEGVVKVERIGDIRAFRIINPGKNIYLYLCDSTALSQDIKVDGAKVRFDSQVKSSCFKPNEHPLPPIYSPTQITQIAPL